MPKYEKNGTSEFIEAVHSLAHISHEVWRSSRVVNPNADVLEYKPRLKPVDLRKDRVWIKAHGDLVKNDSDGRPSVDIAQLTLEELPPSLMKEAKGSLEVSYAAVQEYAEDGMPLDDDAVEDIAGDVHIAWLKRNFPKISRDEIKRFKQRKDEIKKMERAGTMTNDSVRLEFERRDMQFLDYRNPAFQQERDYDRESVLLSIREFRKRHPEFAAVAYVRGDFVHLAPDALQKYANDPAFAELQAGGPFEVISAKVNQLLLRVPDVKAGGLVADMSDASLAEAPVSAK